MCFWLHHQRPQSHSWTPVHPASKDRGSASINRGRSTRVELSYDHDQYATSSLLGATLLLKAIKAWQDSCGGSALSVLTPA